MLTMQEALEKHHDQWITIDGFETMTGLPKTSIVKWLIDNSHLVNKSWVIDPHYTGVIYILKSGSNPIPTANKFKPSTLGKAAKKFDESGSQLLEQF